MEKIINGLPVYYINFDESIFESGIDKIAITDNPAIDVMSMRFNKNDKRKLKFSKDKKIIVGPAIIPDKPIYRNDGDVEYYVVFTKEVIEKMVEKFNSEQREIKFNFDHNDKKEINGFIKESWIIEDDEFDKSKLYGFNKLPIGTWMISAKITDDEIWDYVIKNLESVGFSIQGLMGIQKNEFNKNKNKNKTMKKVKKNKYFSNQVKLKRKFNKSKKRFEKEVVVSDEVDVLISEDLEEGTEVEVVTDEGIIAQAEDGTYIIPEENVEIVIEEGVITEVEEVETIVEEELETDEEEKKEEELESDEDKDKEEEKLETDEDEEELESDEVKDEDEKIDEDEIIKKISELESKIEDVEKDVDEIIDENELEFRKKKKTKNDFSKAKNKVIQSLIYFNKSNFRK